ncbi:MAG: hypothetical protein H8D78_14595 [Chloroflexi bacterium]|nr:hypothetical protein [Chloroflexota bacterium]
MSQQLSKSGHPEGPLPEGTSGIAPPVQHRGRRGFLPIRTNTFDRVFISVVCFVAIHLLWMRFVEASLPLWVATALTLILAVLIVRWG